MPLPPLPPTPGDDEEYRPGGRSMIDLLRREHQRIIRLCAELTADGAGERRGQLAEVLTATVSRHLSAEEQYLYPALRAAARDGDRLAERELAEDTTLLRTLSELIAGTPGEADFDRLAGEVRDRLRRHAETADREILPAIQAAATEAELIRLGNRVEIAEEAAPTRPHPGTPSTPPWNRVVEPAVGVVDKVRDAVSNRPTYPHDLPTA